MAKTAIKQCTSRNRPMLHARVAHEKTVYVMRPNCKMWKCSYCATLNRDAWAERIKRGIQARMDAGEEFYMLTVTSHEKIRAFGASIKVWRSAWPKLYARLKRQHKDMIYVLLPEQHKKDNTLHVHIVINCKVSQKWLKDNARECGLGYQCEVSRKIENAGYAAGYVTKYVGKSLGVVDWPENFRRIRTSQNFPRVELKGRGELTFEAIYGEQEIQRTMRDLQGRGYRIVNLRSGEILGDGTAWIPSVIEF